MSDDRFLDIETKLAYQEDLVASLNQIVSAQQRKLDELEAAYRKLVDRVVEQLFDDLCPAQTGGVTGGGHSPPSAVYGQILWKGF